MMTYRLRDAGTSCVPATVGSLMCSLLLYVQLLLLVDGQMAVVPVRLFQCMYMLYMFVSVCRGGLEHW